MTRKQIFMACVYRKSFEMESEDREHDLGVSIAVSSHHDATLPPSLPTYLPTYLLLPPSRPAFHPRPKHRYHGT